MMNDDFIKTMNDIEKKRLDDEVNRTLDLLDAHPRREASPWFAGRVAARLRRPAEARAVAGWPWAAAGLLLLLNAYALFFPSDSTESATGGAEQTLSGLYDPGEDADALFYLYSPNDLNDEISPAE